MRASLFALSVALIAATLVACGDSSPNQPALRAEYDAAWQKVSTSEFTANYELSGSGGSLVTRGTLRWTLQGPKLERFDGDIETSNGTHDVTTLIQSGSHRTVCNVPQRNCSDYLTALQGSDWYAIALLLPVAEWSDQPTADVDAIRDESIVDEFDGTASSSRTDRCFAWRKHGESSEFRTCFRIADGMISSRRSHVDEDGVVSDLEWTLIDASRSVLPAAFDAPFPVTHRGN